MEILRAHLMEIDSPTCFFFVASPPLAGPLFQVLLTSFVDFRRTDSLTVNIPV